MTIALALGGSIALFIVFMRMIIFSTSSAARSEEINATSHALNGYARELEKQTGKFRV
ncbi:hypothetical protein MELB17_06784 [Marinobacter sp. ELB17]|nr:hypothetical protein MELB17_06784 [Marinobacter sp. ELB17]